MTPTINFNTCTPQDLRDYINQFIVTNHNNEITAEQHNNIENGLLDCIVSSPRNYNKAYVGSISGAFSASCQQCILIFKTGATGTIHLTDNRWNEWVIYNNSGASKQFIGSITTYKTQTGITKNYVGSGQVLNLAKGIDNIWYEIDNGIGGGGTSALPPLIGVVDDGGMDDPVSGTSIFQNDKLIGLGDTNGGRIQIVIAEQIMSNFGDNSSFVLDNTIGELDISPNQFVAGSSFYVNRNQ